MVVADFIVKYLKKSENLTHIFAYAGGTDTPLLDSIHRCEGVNLVINRHEQAVSLAAAGYALAGERLGVAVAMSGPGATNMVTGIADCWFDSIPVLYLTGQVTTGTYKFDNPARQIGYQETDIVSIVKSITKLAELEIYEDKIPNTLRRMISKAKSLRPGPVLFDIPFDILRKELKSSIDELDIPVKLESPPPVSRVAVDSFLRVLSSAKRPLIIAGGGVSTKKARDLLFDFVERLKIPVVTSFNGKGVFPNDHPLYFGFIGAYGNRYANITMANADLILAIGSRLDTRQTSMPSAFAREAVKIQVEIDRNELNNNLVTDLSIYGDICDFMQKVLEVAPVVPVDRYSDWKEYNSKLFKEFDPLKDGKGTDENVNPKVFLNKLSIENNDPTIYVTDVGNNSMFAAQTMVIKRNQKFLVSGGLGTMGFAIPAAIGAYFATPNNRIIAIMGDGGFQMASYELQTIVHYNIPLHLVVLNNNVLGLMKVFQDENYNGVYPATVEGYSAPDLGKVARAYGLNYYKVTTTEEAIDIIPTFLSEKGPVLLEVVMHKDWTAYPKTRRGLPIEYQNPPIDDELLKKFMIVPMFKSESKK